MKIPQRLEVLHVRRIERHGTLDGGLRVPQSAGQLQQNSPLPMETSSMRIQVHCGIGGREGAREFARGLQFGDEEEMSIRQLWIGTDRIGQQRQRKRALPVFEMRAGQLITRTPGSWIERERALEQLDRPIYPARFQRDVREDAELFGVDAVFNQSVEPGVLGF